MNGRQTIKKCASTNVGSRGGHSVAIHSGDVIVGEPPVEEILASDMTRLVMTCDGVNDEQLRTLIGEVRSRLL
jgi:hypothetical protein